MSSEQKFPKPHIYWSKGRDGYRVFRDDMVYNHSMTVGIMNQGGADLAAPDWITGVQPELLEQWARLIRFCHASEPFVEIGLVYPNDDDEPQIPALAAGFPDEDRVIMLAPKLPPKNTSTEEGYAGP